MRSQGTGRLGGQVTQTACCVHFWHCSPGFPQTQVPTNLGHVYYRTDQRLETRVQFPWAETLDLGQCFLLRVRGSPYPLVAGGILHPLLLALWATSEPSTSTSSHGLLLCLWLGGPRVYLRAHLDKARSSPTFSPWAWSHPPDPCSPGHSWESPFRLAHSIFHPSKAPGTPHWWRGKGGGLWESTGQGCLIECYHRVRVNDDHVIIISVQFSSVAQSYPTLYDPMDCSTPGLPVHHHLPEFAQTHVHYACDTIQPSHPLSSPSPPAFNISQHQDFSNESGLHIRWPKYWSFSFSISPFNEYSGLISFRMTALISLISKGLSRVFSNTTVQKCQFFGIQKQLAQPPC